MFLFEVSLCKKYQINKYPTLKLFRNGLVNKREYRKSRFQFQISNRKMN